MKTVKRSARFALNLAASFGLDIQKLLWSCAGLPFYVGSLFRLQRQRRRLSNGWGYGLPMLCLDDRFTAGGTANGHYFHQDLLVAKRIFANRPVRHLDVGSRVDGFVAHVAAFRSIEVIDIRPMSSAVGGMTFVQADLMRELPPDLRECCDSLSCLHALEHFGLGRYGDNIDVAGHLVGLANLHRLLAPGGRFYFSVPIGPQRIEFNAHRVFSVAHLLELLQPGFTVDAVSVVDDRGDLHEDVGLAPADVANSYGCQYGCGIFELTKK